MEYYNNKIYILDNTDDIGLLPNQKKYYLRFSGIISRGWGGGWKIK